MNRQRRPVFPPFPRKRASSRWRCRRFRALPRAGPARSKRSSAQSVPGRLLSNKPRSPPWSSNFWHSASNWCSTMPANFCMSRPL